MAEHSEIHLVVDNAGTARRHPREAALAMDDIESTIRNSMGDMLGQWQFKEGMYAFRRGGSLRSCRLTYPDSRALWYEGWTAAWHVFLDRLEEIDDGRL